mmetsp:Transcript_33606/g.77527  ORF Transcript_33606/g.77527 Transcript_33606/m.77527 type:complete len:180 (-) Transcript_33606:91-630(-)
MFAVKLTSSSCLLACLLLVFYFRPSRYNPKTSSTNSILDNLVFVMNCMMEKEKSATGGIGLIANMTEFKMTNFTVSYWHKLMTTLQGRRSPARVELFLIVNPPAWFKSNIWLIMKPMLSDEFRKNVHMISFHGMKNHLQNGYEMYLPDDIHGGRVDTLEMVKGFVEIRKRIESSRILTG